MFNNFGTKISGQTIDILEELNKKVHISTEEAFNILNQYINSQGELAEDILNKVLIKLSDDEKQLLLSMLLGKGIKILPISRISKIYAQQSEQDINSKVEAYRKKILDLLNEDAIIEEEALQKVINEITDPVVKARILEWLVETPLISEIKLQSIKGKENAYRKKVRKIIKKITGKEVFYA